MAVHRCRAALNTVNALAVRMDQQSHRFLAPISAKPSALDARTAASRAWLSTHHYLHLPPALREAASQRFHRYALEIFGHGGEK